MLADCWGRSLTRHVADPIPHEQRWQQWTKGKEIQQNFSHPQEGE